MSDPTESSAGIGTAEVSVHASAAEVAEFAAGNLLETLRRAQLERDTADVVLTGGGVGTATLRAVSEHPNRDSLDWSRLRVWWGDERFVASDSTDRNDVGAAEALLDRVPLDRSQVFRMPAVNDMDGTDVDAAAARYAGWLADAAPGLIRVPAFDVLLLGVGPDGHVASLFPGHPELSESDRMVVAVRDSPKPPPTRISLTYPAINSAREVWLLAAGAEKADAVGAALSGSAEVSAIPAVGVRGTVRTRWLLDRAAARDLSAD